MKILYPGHSYLLPNQDGSGEQRIDFVRRKPHHEPVPGILNQQLLRVLIDRVGVLNAEKPWEGNARILMHLRLAIAEHECRALIQRTFRVLVGDVEIIPIHVGVLVDADSCI